MRVDNLHDARAGRRDQPGRDSPHHSLPQGVPGRSEPFHSAFQHAPSVAEARLLNCWRQLERNSQPNRDLLNRRSHSAFNDQYPAAPHAPAAIPAAPASAAPAVPAPPDTTPRPPNPCRRATEPCHRRKTQCRPRERPRTLCTERLIIPKTQPVARISIEEQEMAKKSLSALRRRAVMRPNCPVARRTDAVHRRQQCPLPFRRNHLGELGHFSNTTTRTAPYWAGAASKPTSLSSWCCAGTVVPIAISWHGPELLTRRRPPIRRSSEGQRRRREHRTGALPALQLPTCKRGMPLRRERPLPSATSNQVHRFFLMPWPLPWPLMESGRCAPNYSSR